MIRISNICLQLSLNLFFIGFTYSVQEIAEKLSVNQDTVYDWLVKFTNHGIKGLMDKPIPGRPRKLKTEHEKDIKDVLKKSS